MLNKYACLFFFCAGRICQEELGPGSDALRLACRCKHGLENSHRACAAKWFLQASYMYA